MGFSRQKCQSGLPFPPSGDLPNTGIEPTSPVSQAASLPTEPLGKPLLVLDFPKDTLLFNLYSVTARVHGQTRKSRNLQTDRKPCILGDNFPGSRKERWGKVGSSWVMSVSCCSLCSHYSKFSLAAKKYPSGTDAFWSKLNEDENLSSPWDDGAGMKMREYNLPSPPSPGNIPPLHLYTSHNRLAKEAWSSCSSPLLPARPLTLYPCLNKFSFYFLNLPAFLQILLHRGKNLKFTRNSSSLSWTSFSCIIKLVLNNFQDPVPRGSLGWLVHNN